MVGVHWIAVALSAVTACLPLACVSNPPERSLQFSIASDCLKEGPPQPVVIAAGDESSSLITDTVNIAPETLGNYQNLPTTVTQIYDTPPLDLALSDVVTETMANNRQILAQSWTLRGAEYQIPIARSVYDLSLGGSLQISKTETQLSARDRNRPELFFADNGNTSTVDRSSLPASMVARTREGRIQANQLLPTGAVIDTGYDAVRDEENNHLHQAPLGITQPLLRGFGPYVTNAEIRRAELELQGSEADFRARVEDQLVAALEAYWDLTGAIQVYKVGVIAFATTMDLMRINREFYAVGVRITIADLAQTEAALQREKALLIQARQNIRDIEDRLKRLIFLQPESPMWEAQINPTQAVVWRDIQPDLERAIVASHERRPEIERARSNLAQREVDVRVARNRILPLLNLFGRIIPNADESGFRDAVNRVGNGNYISYFAGLEFSIPLQNRAARFRYRQAVAGRDRARESLKDTLDQVTLEVRTAARALGATRERIAATRSRIASEQENLNNALIRLEVGLITTYRVLQFQQDLASAQVEHVRAVIDHNKAGIRFERARGTLLETYGVGIQKMNGSQESEVRSQNELGKEKERK